MSNVYHILHHPPALEAEDMFVELEELAARLVASGRLRIDAGPKRNFVRYTDPYENIDMVFSERELTDPELLKGTEKAIGYTMITRLTSHKLQHKIHQEIERLRDELSRAIKVEPELEMQLARTLTQSTHPIVLELALLEEIEIFISYSHNIGDLVNIEHWQSWGVNSGLQSTDGRESAVFVSCGGNPLAQVENNEHHGDGFPALARMMVIAAQELGHYADLIRDPQGRKIARHSADLGARRARPQVQEARATDIRATDHIAQTLDRCGIRTWPKPSATSGFSAKSATKVKSIGPC